MRVKINGKPEDIQNGTVLDLLKTKNIEPQMVAVEATAHRGGHTEREPGIAVQRAQRRKHDPGVAVGVTATEVIEIDAIVALADRHLVLERLLRQARLLLPPEGLAVADGAALLLRPHGPHILVDDDLDRRGKLGDAARMVAVSVAVERHDNRLVRHRLDLVHDHRSPAGVLLIDDHALFRESLTRTLSADPGFEVSDRVAITINLPRIGYLSNSVKEFKARLWRLVQIGRTSLELKRKIIEQHPLIAVRILDKMSRLLFYAPGGF